MPATAERTRRAGGLAPVGAAILLAGCASPLTSPPGVEGCASYMTPYKPSAFETTPDQAELAAQAAAPATGLERMLTRKLAAAPPAGQKPLAINVLVLSGGAEWGAYGAGFLNGLYGQTPTPPGEIPLGDYDFVSGISTGAIMATEAWLAIIYGRDPAGGANYGLQQLANLYQVSDAQLFTAKNPLLSIVFSNGALDPTGLEGIVRQRVNAYIPVLRADTAPDQVEVGAVNVRNGNLYSFDLKAMARSGEPGALDCYSSAILASSAIPLAFPPRYIDGYPYFDGGVRYLAYFDDVLLKLKQSGRNVALNLVVVVNGNQSANDPGGSVDLAKAAEEAAACDRGTLANTTTTCPPVANTMLGDMVPGQSGKGLVPRTVEDIMVQQTKIDSVFRLYTDWKASGLPGTFRYTYIPNWRLAAPPAAAGLTGPCQPSNTTDQFNQPFMNCLFKIGQYEGQTHDWTCAEAQGPDAVVAAGSRRCSAPERRQSP
jgi:predicted acylesterase/phospholipase RssA